MKKIFLLLLATILTTSGCVARDAHILGTNESQLKTRSIQTREFESGDRALVTRNVVSTLQDLGFVIDDADADLGTVSATKLKNAYQSVKVTVQVRPKNEEKMLVRANARYNLKPIEDPVIYQNFFLALEKSLFLTAHAVD